MKKNVIALASLASFFGSFSGQFISFGLGIAILTQTGSALYFGLSQFLGPLLISILNKLTIYLLSKYNKFSIIIWTQVVTFFLTGILITLVKIYTTYDNQVMIMLTLIILGINDYVSHLFGIAYDVNLKCLVEQSKIDKLRTAEEISGSISLIIAPILAAYCYMKVDMILILCCALLLDVVTFLIISTMKSATIDQSENKIEETVSNNQIDRENLKWLMIIPTLMSISFVSINIGLPYIQIRDYHLLPNLYALTKVSWSIGMLISGLTFLTSMTKRIRQEKSNILLFLGVEMMILANVLFVMHSDKGYFLSLLVFNLIFAYTLVQYRVMLSVYLMGILSEDDLPYFYNRQRMFEQLTRALSAVVLGVAYDKLNSLLLLFFSGFFILVIWWLSKIRKIWI